MGIEQQFTVKKYSWITLLLAVFALWIVAQALDFNGLYGQDSHAYYQYSESLLQHWKTGAPKPFFFWPLGYPLSGAMLSLLGFDGLFALQFISICALSGALLLARKCIIFLWKRDGTLWLILAAVTQVYFVRAGFLVMSDMLCAFCILVVIYSVLCYRESRSVVFLILLLTGAVCAFFIRYASIVLLIVPLLYAARLFLVQLKIPVRILLVLTLVGGAYLLVLVNSWFLTELVNRLGSWSFSYFYERTIISQDGTVTNTVPNGVYVFGNFFHPGFLSCGSVLIFFYKKLDKNSCFLLLTAGIYFFFLAGLNMQNYRFLVIAHLPVVIALFPAFTAAYAYLRKPFLKRGAVVAIIVVNAVFAWYSFGKMWRVHCLEKAIAQAVKQLENDEPIYSFFVDQSFPSYGIRNKVHNFFLEECTEFETGALVVFNEQQFASQWKDLRVMRNWNRLKQQHTLDTLRIVEQNWIIYRIR